MDVWRAEIKKLQNTGIPKLLTVFFGASTKSQKPPLEQLLVDRLTVCYDLASALMYLHEHKIVYRDIKPENIGFDHRGKLVSNYSRVATIFFPVSLFSRYDAQETSNCLTLDCVKI